MLDAVLLGNLQCKLLSLLRCLRVLDQTFLSPFCSIIVQLSIIIYDNRLFVKYLGYFGAKLVILGLFSRLSRGFENARDWYGGFDKGGKIVYSGGARGLL